MIAVSASLQDFKTSFTKIVALEGCKTACATQLLTAMGFVPASTLYLSDKSRETEQLGLNDGQDADIDRRVPGIVEELVQISDGDKEKG